VNEVRTGSAPSSTTQKPDAAKKTAFAKALEEGRPQPAPALLPTPPPAASVEETAPVCGVVKAKDLDGLAREIGAALRVNDGKEVEIRFDSKTLAGLEIRIRKEDGKLNVKLNCDSPGMNAMIAGQIDGLVERLETRGYAAVKVELRSEPRPAAFHEPRSRGGQGGQGKQDQQKQRQR
jgi:hypothetical protein